MTRPPRQRSVQAKGRGLLGPVCLIALVRAMPAVGVEARTQRQVGRDAAPPAQLELKPEVEVTGELIRLGDVAAITTLELATLERLMSLPLGSAPRTGTVVRLERDRIVRWIRSRTGLSAGRLELTGAQEILVRRSSAIVSGQAIAARAATTLAEVARRAGIESPGIAPRVPRDVVVPAGTLELSPRPITRFAWESRAPTVWVDLLVDERFIRTVPVAFDRVAEAGEADGGTALPPEKGLRAARAQQGDPVLVRRGAWARLLSNRGAISLETRVAVLEDGRRGEAVQVQVAKASGSIRARVTGPGTLEVEP